MSLQSAQIKKHQLFSLLEEFSCSDGKSENVST